MAGFQNIYHALVAEEDVWLVHQCVPVHGPEAVSEPILIQSPAMIGIMHVVVIHRRQAHQEDGPAMNGRARSAVPRIRSALSEWPLTGNCCLGSNLSQAK